MVKVRVLNAFRVVFTLFVGMVEGRKTGFRSKAFVIPPHTNETNPNYENI